MGQIVVSGLSKKYPYRPPRPTVVAPNAGTDRRIDGKRDFWALRDIDFGVGRGEMFGIIGANGAGKSTLLRLVGGVGRPTKGAVKTQGRVGALLELGADFHPELTGRENAITSGVINGLTRREMRYLMDDIIEFAGLRDFIDAPVRTYSSGMLVRLAFAIVVSTQPDVLLIDEVLAVGDQDFQARCLARIDEFKRSGCAILLVTHDTELAGQMCDQVLWLHKGAVAEVGGPEKVIASYLRATDLETRRRTPADWAVDRTADGTELRMLDNRFGSMELQITDVRFLDSNNFRSRYIRRGEGLRIEIDYESRDPLPAPNFGVIIRQEDNRILFDGNVPGTTLGLNEVRGSGTVVLRFDRLDLNSGTYLVDVGAYKQDWAYAYDYHWRAYPLNVVSASLVKGAVNPPHQWEFIGEKTFRAR